MPAVAGGTDLRRRGYRSMSQRADMYRRRAAECRLWAGAASEPKLRLTYAELAAEWEEMARQVEFIEEQVPQR